MALQQERAIRTLRCPLTPEELAETAQKMAEAEIEAQHSRDELSAVGADLRTHIKRLVADVHSYALRLQDGYEDRPIDCEITRNLSTMRMITVRLDTGEKIDDVPIPPDEVQTMLEIAQEPGIATEDAGGSPEKEEG